MTERMGKVIFLNGTSSSGKSTIAGELQKVLHEPYLHVSCDAFLSQLPGSAGESWFHREIDGIVAAFHSSAARSRAMATILSSTQSCRMRAGCRNAARRSADWS